MFIEISIIVLHLYQCNKKPLPHLCDNEVHKQNYDNLYLDFSLKYICFMNNNFYENY